MIAKIRIFLRNYPLSILSLLFYTLFWFFIYQVLFFSDYDNHAAGGMLVVALLIIVPIFVSSFLIGFSVSAYVHKAKRKTYYCFIVILFLPILPWLYLYLK